MATFTIMAVITFAAAGSDRFDEIWALEQRCHPIPWSESTLQSCLAGNYWGELLLLAGQPIGFYLFQQVLDELTLVNICIAPEQQRQGYGEQLLEQALTQALAKQGAICFLEVRGQNCAAIKLYEKCGFAEYGLRPDYYPAITGNGREDALLMSLMLQFR